MKKILVLPGWMTDLILYEKDDDLDVQKGNLVSAGENACIIGLSLGALISLRDWDGRGKLILINPPLPKRNIFVWLIKWVKFILSEGLFFERQKFTKNPFKFIIEIAKCAKILSIDFSKKLDNIPQENLIFMRGKNDKFFCDDKAVQFIVQKGFKIVEVENCGHNWSEAMEKKLKEII